MEYIVVGGKYILRISPASFQMHSTEDYCRCQEKGLLLFPCKEGQTLAAEGALRDGSPSPQLQKVPQTQALQGPKRWSLLRCPWWVCSGWDVGDNEKHSLSAMLLASLLPQPPCVYGFLLTYLSLHRRVEISCEVLEYHLSLSWCSVSI